MVSRIALITGASSDINRACALHLAANGLHVSGTSRNPLGDLALILLQMHLTDDLVVRRATWTPSEREDRIDIVMNDAGIAVAGQRAGAYFGRGKTTLM